ncbi:MAG: hypothetical protein J0L95_15955 [Candidatus Accumulibacter sp.]|jgi:hypothetical protein|uniref:hypothetical protein n=1 Tax=Accumulibacter sp. TaxID=2053492 RepID=UPI001AC4D657|nr:hypothetical protein [Accumulibacter sp.]MBN8439519.1 hypothetical protein [Accumulibacter sp.]
MHHKKWPTTIDEAVGVVVATQAAGEEAIPIADIPSKTLISLDTAGQARNRFFRDMFKYSGG